MFLKCWYCALSSRHSRTHRSYINAIGHCRRKTTSYNNILLLKNGVKVLIVKLNSKTPIQCEMCANIFFFFFLKFQGYGLKNEGWGCLHYICIPPKFLCLSTSYPSYYSQTCPCSHLYLKVTFSCPVIGNFIWIEPLLKGHLSFKATFTLSQRWPLNTGLTVNITS